LSFNLHIFILVKDSKRLHLAVLEYSLLLTSIIAHNTAQVPMVKDTSCTD